MFPHYVTLQEWKKEDVKVIISLSEYSMLYSIQFWTRNLVFSPELLQLLLLESKLSLSALGALLSAAQLQALVRVALWQHI